MKNRNQRSHEQNVPYTYDRFNEKAFTRFGTASGGTKKNGNQEL